MEDLLVYQKPELSAPAVVVGFEGWPDAGGIASGVVSFLKNKLQAERFAEVRPDNFFLFQSPGSESRRPIIRIEEGLVRGLTVPSTTFWFYRNPMGAPDLIIALGPEPELAWNRYIDLFIELVKEQGAKAIYSVGGTYDYIPHTVEPVVSALVNEPALKHEIRAHGIDLTTYEGPSSIHSLLLAAAARRGIRALSLWGHAPHYVQVPNARVCHAVMSKLVGLLGLSIDLEDIRKAGEYLDEQIREAVDQKPELQDYVKQLEEEYREGKLQVRGPLGEDVIKAVEDFLRKTKQGGEPG